MDIALISPSKEAYSETFIQAHKAGINGNIFYYYSGELPSELENGLVLNSRRARLVDLIKGHLNLNRFSLAEKAIISSFRQNRVEVVLAEYGGTGERILPICKELDTPLIVHFHGYDASREDQLRKNHNYKEIFEYASFIIAVSKKMKRDLLKLGCPEDKLILNTYGPNDAFFQIAPTFQKSQFISIGRFVDKKAPYYVILSFLDVVKQFPSAKLIMAGEGELWNSCKNLAEYYGLKENITFPGVISPLEFQEFLTQSLALVQHSITAEDGDSEGTPVSVLEAGAAGLPVLSTHHAGIPDVVVDGETGMLVQEHDVSGMAANMLKLLSDPARATEMGNRARRRIKENFTLEKHLNILNDLIVRSVK